jgi:EAL domain-containing protein (putative c-di-GMP-specific phosphodiesterase class I)
LAVLGQLRAIGVRLAVDDFGTGYSSLAYLQRLPVQAVKIDGTFVGRLDTSTGDAAIVSAIIAVANALGLTAIAEGVERAEQLAELQRLGCVQAQGYLLSRPVPAADLPRALVSALPAWPSPIRPLRSA